MLKDREIEKFTKLSPTEKGKLTISWLSDLVKNNNLTLTDVMDIINSCTKTFSNVDKFNSMIINDYVSASTISRLFGYGYVKSMRILNLLLSENAIVKFENRYKIVDKDKFKQVGQKLFEQ